MEWDQLTATLSAPNKRALLSLMGMMKGHVGLLCHASLAESGILKQLESPKTTEELAAALEIERTDPLQALLDLGVSLGALKRRGRAYQCKGALAKTVATTDGEALAAFLQEQIHYHNQVFRDLPQRLRGGEDGDYLTAAAPMISKGSRMVEPFLRPFAKRITRGMSDPRILEIGCGEGAYLKWYVEDSPGCSGVAIDMDPAVAETAAANLREWGVNAFEVVAGDILSPPPNVGGSFDIVTSFQNAYYFSPEQRIQVFNWVRHQLSPRGALAIVTATAADRLTTHYFSVLLGSTSGCWPLPTVEELQAELRTAGFQTVEKHRLIPFDEFWGFIAK